MTELSPQGVDFPAPDVAEYRDPFHARGRIIELTMTEALQPQCHTITSLIPRCQNKKGQTPLTALGASPGAKRRRVGG
jgi:hypothetical protein